MSSQPTMFKVFSKVMDRRWNKCNKTLSFSLDCNQLLDIHEIVRGTYYLDARRYNEDWGVVVYLSEGQWQQVLQMGRENVAREGRAIMKRRTRKFMRTDTFKGCSKQCCQAMMTYFVQFAANHAVLFGGTPPMAYDVARERGALVDMNAERFDALYDKPEKKPRRRTRKKRKHKKKAGPKQVRSEFDGHGLVPLPSKKKPAPAQPLGVERLRRGIEQLWSARDARNVVEKQNGVKNVVV